MNDHSEVPGAGDEEQRREREAVYDGWRLCETLEDVEEQKALVDRYAERNPCTVAQSNAAIAREMLRTVHGAPRRVRLNEGRDVRG